MGKYSATQIIISGSYTGLPVDPWMILFSLADSQVEQAAKAQQAVESMGWLEGTSQPETFDFPMKYKGFL